MAITAEARSNLIKLVVGMFNAAPGANILSQLTAIYEGGATLQQIAVGLSTKSQFTQIYPTFLTNEEFAERLADNLLGDEVSASTHDTATTWVEARLNAGVSRGLVIAEAVSLIANAPTTGDFADARAAFENKVEVATYFSVEEELSADSLAELQAVLDGVTSDDDTVDTAKEAIDENVGNSSGDIFTLTEDLGENVEGTGGNDTFNIILNNGGADETLNTFDTIDGLGGTDTLNIVAMDKADELPSSNVVTGVEIVRVSADVELAALDASGLEDVTTLIVAGAGATAITLGKGQSVTLANEDATAAGITVNVNGKETTTTLTLLDIVDAEDITLVGAKNETLNVVGSADDTLSLTAAATTETLNVSVTSDTAFTVTGAAITTLDASESTGDLTFNALAAVETLIGGSGDDTLTGGAASQEINGGDGDDTITAGGVDGEVIIGGEGADTITLGAGEEQTVVIAAGDTGVTAATSDRIVNFEVADDVLDFEGIEGDTDNFLNGGTEDSYINALTNALTAFDGEVQIFVQNNGVDTWVFLDSNSDGELDASIILTGNIALTADNFIAA